MGEVSDGTGGLGADQSACGWGQLLQLARVPMVVGRPHPVLKEVAVLVRDDLQPACLASTSGAVSLRQAVLSYGHGNGCGPGCSSLFLSLISVVDNLLETALCAKHSAPLSLQRSSSQWRHPSVCLDANVWEAGRRTLPGSFSG